MVGCFIRFGSLPGEGDGESLMLVVADSSGRGVKSKVAQQSSSTTKLNNNNKDGGGDGANPWWADDDETAFTGDDDFYNKEDNKKRVRGGTKQKKNTPTGTTDINIETQKQPKKQSAKEALDFPTTSDAKTSTSLSVSPQPINTDNNNIMEQSSSSNTNTDRPKMVWLMSYPNSGTSYTMTFVSQASNRVTATNYGREVTNPPDTNVPLYPGQWDGPFYRPNPKRPLPDDYIMVKTHCGGTYCRKELFFCSTGVLFLLLLLCVCVLCDVSISHVSYLSSLLLVQDDVLPVAQKSIS